MLWALRQRLWQATGKKEGKPKYGRMFPAMDAMLPDMKDAQLNAFFGGANASK